MNSGNLTTSSYEFVYQLLHDLFTPQWQNEFIQIGELVKYIRFNKSHTHSYEFKQGYTNIPLLKICKNWHDIGLEMALKWSQRSQVWVMEQDPPLKIIINEHTSQSSVGLIDILVLP